MSEPVHDPHIPTRPHRPGLAEVFAAEHAADGPSCGQACPWDEALVCARPAGHEDGQQFTDIHLHTGDGGLVQWHDQFTPFEPAQMSPPDPVHDTANTPDRVLAALAAALGYEDPETLRAALTAAHSPREGS